MRKIFVLMMVMISATVFSQNNDAFKMGIDFMGIGNEPFWNVAIDIDKGIKFSSLKDDLKIETGLPFSPEISDVAGMIYIGESDKYSVEVTISKDTCNDTMSDRIYYYSVNVSVMENDTREEKEFKGCGMYVYDKDLNSTWILEKINGKDISEDAYFKTKPYIEFRVNEGRIAGKSGCNNFMGYAEARGNKIHFSAQMAATMMMCPDMTLEREFFVAISGKILEYKIENGRLMLTDKETTVMEFAKKDN